MLWSTQSIISTLGLMYICDYESTLLRPHSVCTFVNVHLVPVSNGVSLCFCSFLHSKVNMKSNCVHAEMLWVQGSGLMSDCWLKCHTLGEIEEFYWGGWKAHRAPCSAWHPPHLPSFLFIASCIHALLSLCAAWMGHTHSSNMLLLANCAKKLSPLSPLIPLSRGQGVGVAASQRGWQQRAISAYLNCELITSSRFPLSSVHYCLHPHEYWSILAAAQGSIRLLCIIFYHLHA